MITAVANSPVSKPICGGTHPSPATGMSVRIGLVLLGLLTFVNSATFIRGEPNQYQFDWHIALRLALCGVCGLYGVAHLQYSATTLFRGAGLSVSAFGCWIALIVPFALVPTNAAGACFTVWSVALFAAALSVNVELSRIIRCMAASLFVFLIGCWAAYLFWPSLGREELPFPDGRIVERFGGLGSSQSVGLVSALEVALLVALGTQRSVRWKTLTVPLALAVLTIYVTNSRTSSVAAILVSLVATIRSMRRTRAVVFLFFVLPFVAAIGAALFNFGVVKVNEEEVVSKLTRSGESVELSNVSGRTEIWSFFLEKFHESPLVGYGLSCSRFVSNQEYLHAHNQLLNLAVETGLLGALLVFAQFLILCHRFIVAPNAYFDLFFLVAHIGGLTERVPFAPISDCFTLLWFLAVLWPSRRTYSPARRGSCVNLASSCAGSSEGAIHFAACSWSQSSSKASRRVKCLD
jgi:hypothetical protein